MSSQKIPAWKRLGLKLKQPASGSEIGGPAPAEGSKPNGQQHHDRNLSGPVVSAANAAAAAAAKRKRPEYTSTPPAFSSPLKRTRTDGYATTPTLRKQKSVTFTDDTKKPAAVEPANAKKKKKTKTKTAQPIVQVQGDITPSLEYLRHWKSSRETWKFKKNYQTILMNRVFQSDQIPSSDIDTFYDYIQDLKGFIRKRLRETAAEVKKEDADKGKDGFPAGTPDMDSKQSEYEKVLEGLMQLSSGSSKRKRFDEPAFVTQSNDVAITQRVVKRMRAETILEELVDSEDSDAMAIDTEKSTTSSAPAKEEVTDRRAKPNDGVKQNAPRRRKMRTNVDDTSSDESSDDDSDDDSSSDSSDDESDTKSEVQRQAAAREAETSSSSSSSSSEDEDDSSDDDSSDEEETKRPASKK